MQPVIEHPWQLTPAEAGVLQNELRGEKGVNFFSSELSILIK
jgi:hypothetical protein